MKLKVLRASLPGVLTAALLLSLVPSARSVARASQAEQETSQSQNVRRGKNGASTGKTPANSDNPPSSQASSQDATGASKPASASQTGEQPAAATSENSKSKTQPGRDPFDNPDGTGSAPQPEHEAPPFDRSPVRGQQQSQRTLNDRAGGKSTASGSPSRSDSSSPGTARTSYPTQPTRSPSSTAPPRDSYPDSNNDPGSNRSTGYGGQPPVLRRQPDTGPPRDNYPDRTAGTESSGERSTRSGGQPPVLHRPGDPQERDDSNRAPVDSRRQSGSTQQKSSGQQQPGGEDEVVKLESTLVSIPLLVSDRSGRYVPQLRASDFLLYEDGVQQNIASLGNEEVPFNVALMLDVSPSVAGSVKDIQDAAIAFVRQLRSQDRVMVISFDRHIHYLSDFTSDRRELERAIHSAQLGSGTSVYDAVYETVERKLRNIEGRKALILLSDGEDTTSSRASYDDAVNLVSESDVLVYGLRYPGTGGRGGIRVDPWPRNPIPNIPLPFPWPFPRRRRGPFNISGSPSAGNSAVQSWPHRRDGGRDFMKDLAAAGGGTVYDAQRISDMSGVANKIAEELRHVYVLSYYPSNALSNGGYRKVRVSVKSRDEIAVRHRPGYNARPNGTARPTI